ncbi:MAG: decaprenyl-phosphate phosphoribosyltransferase [Lentisphaerae bacterium]|nr:decaprenyl-phosphate phosphoribosyltransferase [Lentisphaerota bacterium]
MIPATPATRPKLPPLLRALRPSQWTKNGVVLVAYFFARWDPSQNTHTTGWLPLLLAAGAAVAFCALSSAVYLVNDIHDRTTDRLHPQKRFRPIASGELSITSASIVAAILAASATIASFAITGELGMLALLYLLLQAAYTWSLRSIPLVDTFIIAAGFVIRAIAGAAAIDVRISPWLLLCAFLLALFLALCKRRHEKNLSDNINGQTRGSLDGYDARVLDQAIAVVSAATVVSYALYTLSEETVSRFGTNRLGLTIPFVLFGILRYIDLVYRNQQGGRPEKVLLTDRVLIVTIILYGLTAFIVFQLG